MAKRVSQGICEETIENEGGRDRWVGLEKGDSGGAEGWSRVRLEKADGGGGMRVKAGA